MPNKKTISVIIPCYNYAQYLGECLESILKQSILPDEVVIVDDESTDDPWHVVRDFLTEDPSFKVNFISQKNKGLSGARNTGIRAATSEYIMCLDADDILRPDAIKEHLMIADDKSIAQCGLMYFGTQVGTFRPMGATLESLVRSNSVYCNSVFPKTAWEEIGGFDESEVMRLGLEDWLAWIEMAAKGYKVKTNDYIGLLYRRHDSAMTKKTTHPRWNEIIAYMKKKIKEKYGLETFFQPIHPTTN